MELFLDDEMNEKLEYFLISIHGSLGFILAGSLPCQDEF